MFRETLFFILQCVMLHWNGMLLKEKSFEERVLIQEKANHLHQWMDSLGAAYRDTSTIGLFLLSIFSSLPIVFWTLDRRFFKNSLKQFQSEGFIGFLRSPECESKVIIKKINTFVQQTIDSNVNYTFYVAIAIIRQQQTINSKNSNYSFRDHNKTIQANIRKEPYIDFYDDLIKQSSYENYNSTLDRFNYLKKEKLDLFCYARRNSNLIKSLHAELSDQKNEKDDVYYMLRQQLRHLETLLNGEKTSVWPANRNNEWCKKLRKVGFRLYLLIMVGLIPTAQCILAFLHHICVKKPNKLDIFNLIEEYFILFFTVDRCIVPMILLISKVFDQLRSLGAIMKKFDLLFQILKELGLLRGDFIMQKSIVTQSDRKIKQTSISEKDLRSRCDKLATELYISFRLFMSEAELSCQWAQNLMDQRIWFGLVMLVPTFIFMDQIEPSHSGPIAMCSAMLILGINFIFYVCAFLHASCTRATKRIWSLIAMSLESTLCATYNDDNYYFDDKLEYHDQFDNLNFNQAPLQTAISRHTILLWSRIVSDQQKILENFIIKILGNFRIDSNGILRINFWVFSAILIFLTYKSS